MCDRINLTVVIVEPHHHALEHIHHMIRNKLRQRRRNTKGINQTLGWTMVHFDSHPDLACPNDRIPARLCFNPRETKQQCICCTLSSINSTMVGGHTRSDDINNECINECDCNLHKSRFSCDEASNNRKDAYRCDSGMGMNLYELLDTSQSGIAEWIMPLVLAGGLHTLHWIKNDFCDQFEDGEYNIPIGAWINPGLIRQKGSNDIQCFLDLPDCATVKTSICHDYYLDDNCVVPESELILKQDLNLIVSDLRDTSQKQSICDEEKQSLYERRNIREVENMYINNEGWILDVCLDYFICSNPFITDIEAIDKNLSHLITKAVRDVSFRNIASSSTTTTTTTTTTSRIDGNAEEYLSLSNQFYNLATTFFHNATLSSSTSCSLDKYNLLSEQQYQNLYQLYETPLIGEQIWEDITLALATCVSSSKLRIDEVCRVIVSGLSNMTLPHQTGFDNHTSQMSEQMQLKVKMFGDDLKNHRWCSNDSDLFHSQPSIITIARSSEDGFTPFNIVSSLQQAVLNEIHNVYCNCGNELSLQTQRAEDEKESGRKECNICLVLDYGKYEGSTISGSPND
jgi:hypothetical protein